MTTRDWNRQGQQQSTSRDGSISVVDQRSQQLPVLPSATLANMRSTNDETMVPLRAAVVFVECLVGVPIFLVVWGMHVSSAWHDYRFSDSFSGDEGQLIGGVVVWFLGALVIGGLVGAISGEMLDQAMRRHLVKRMVADRFKSRP